MFGILQDGRLTKHRETDRPVSLRTVVATTQDHTLKHCKWDSPREKERQKDRRKGREDMRNATALRLHWMLLSYL